MERTSAQNWQGQARDTHMKSTETQKKKIVDLAIVKPDNTAWVFSSRRDFIWSMTESKKKLTIIRKGTGMGK